MLGWGKRFITKIRNLLRKCRRSVILIVILGPIDWIGVLQAIDRFLASLVTS